MSLFSFFTPWNAHQPYTQIAFMAHFHGGGPFHGAGIGHAIVNGILFSAIWHGVGSLFRGVSGFNGIVLAGMLILLVLVIRRR